MTELRPSRAADASATPADSDGRLGTTTKSAANAGQRLARERWQLLEGLQRITRHKRLKGCMKTRQAARVSVARTESGGSLAGVCRCGSVHVCPVCSAKIRAFRAEQVETWADAWVTRGGQQGDGGGLALMTLTMRHYKRQELGSAARKNPHGLLGVQHRAWELAFGKAAGQYWKWLKVQLQIVGYYRVWECTCGDNGWHPHWHVLFFTDLPWDDDELHQFEEMGAERWAKAVRRAGGYEVGERGFSIEWVKSGQQAAVGRYLFKEQDGRGGILRIGAEMARGDLKRGRRDNLSVFELAELAVAEELATEKQDYQRLWWEYEKATVGLRLMYMTPHLRRRLDELVDTADPTDDEIAADDGERQVLCVIEGEVWDRHIAAVPGRRTALVEAAGKGRHAVRKLVREWGLEWGKDVLNPPVEM